MIMDECGFHTYTAQANKSYQQHIVINKFKDTGQISWVSLPILMSQHNTDPNDMINTNDIRV